MTLRTSRGDAVTSIPVIRAVPAVGLSKVTRILVTVVLPEPFGPRKPKISPRRTVSEMPSTALVPPW